MYPPLESDFDTIATQNVPWQGVDKNFYKPFHQKVEDAADISREETHGMRVRTEATIIGFDDAKVVSFTNSARHIE
jgi:hypothetical protein